ncbi:monocarboxylate transporter 5-like [Diadema setosum]|uniref:monocarboxylate transporter 5-like n=1 Tax=Diadema setosum TaxID=31175 RepID=UPI003B3A0560
MFHFNRIGWLVAFGSFVQMTIIFGIISSFVVLFVLLEEEFEASATATGWMGSMAWGVAILFAPVSAALNSQWGPRPVTAAGVCLCTIGLLATCFLPNLWAMYITFGLVFGAGANMITFSSADLIAKHFPGKSGTRPFAFANLSGAAGLLVVATIVDSTVDAIGWRMTYSIFAAILFVICFPLCFVYKYPSVLLDEVKIESANGSDDSSYPTAYVNSAVQVVEERSAESSVITEANSPTNGDESDKSSQLMKEKNSGIHSTETERKSSIAGLLRVPGIWMSGLATMAIGIASTLNVIILGGYLENIGISSRLSSVLIMALGLAELLGRLLALVVGSSIPVSNLIILGVVHFSGTIVCLMVGLLSNLVTTIIYIAIAGIIRGIIYSINLPATMEVFKGVNSSIIISVMFLGNGIGNLLSSICAGLSVDVTSSYSAAFFMSAGLYFISSAIYVSLWLWPDVLIFKRILTDTHPSRDQDTSVER